MLTVGLLGGISYTSSLSYYKELNELVNAQYGGLSSSKIILNSLNLAEYAKFASDGDFQSLKELILQAAKSLQNSGADFLVICSNTAHMSYPLLISELPSFPILHIADCCAKYIKEKQYCKVGFIGTRYSMSQNFIQKRLEEHLIDLITPNEKIFIIIQEVINDLSVGILNDNLKEKLIDLINDFQNIEKIDCLLLGCTELPLLIKQNDIPNLPIIDSTYLHINAAFKIQTQQLNISHFLPSSH